MKDVRIELDAEIVRSKELLARQPHSNSHHSRPDIDTKHAAAIRFYEDFSNLLVLSIKFEQRGGVQDDVLYTCMYTHVGTMKDDETDATEQIEKSKSSLLSFFSLHAFCPRIDSLQQYRFLSASTPICQMTLNWNEASNIHHSSSINWTMSSRNAWAS